jgi:hypothetical protein
MIVFDNPAGSYKFSKIRMLKHDSPRFEEENYPGGLWSG